jgi:hypothetical protein
MRKYRNLLKATVRDESHNHRTSKEIAAIFQKRHSRAIAAVASALILSKIIKDIDGVSHLTPKSVDPRQAELFDEYKIIIVIPFPVLKDGKQVRIERRALGDLTVDELAQWISYRQTRPARKTESLENYIRLHNEIKPYASGATTISAAYRAMKKAQKRA